MTRPPLSVVVASVNGMPYLESCVAALAEHFSQLGYVDDAAFAAGKSRSLAARGYGARRLTQALHLERAA